jgi:hypothetical protein
VTQNLWGETFTRKNPHGKEENDSINLEEEI